MLKCSKHVMKTKQLIYSLIVKFDIETVQHSPIILITENNYKQTQKKLQFKQNNTSQWSVHEVRAFKGYCFYQLRVLVSNTEFSFLRLVSSKTPFPSPAFSTHTDGFPSEEVSPSFPRIPLTMKSNRADGVGCLTRRPGQETGVDICIQHCSCGTQLSSSGGR